MIGKILFDFLIDIYYILLNCKKKKKIYKEINFKRF